MNTHIDAQDFSVGEVGETSGTILGNTITFIRIDRENEVESPGDLNQDIAIDELGNASDPRRSDDGHGNNDIVHKKIVGSSEAFSQFCNGEFLATRRPPMHCNMQKTAMSATISSITRTSFRLSTSVAVGRSKALRTRPVRL
jgi:hypothetical protein